MQPTLLVPVAVQVGVLVADGVSVIVADGVSVVVAVDVSVGVPVAEGDPVGVVVASTPANS
jgi:hypothetical protein